MLRCFIAGQGSADVDGGKRRKVSEGRGIKVKSGDGEAVLGGRVMIKREPGMGEPMAERIPKASFQSD